MGFFKIFHPSHRVQHDEFIYVTSIPNDYLFKKWHKCNYKRLQANTICLVYDMYFTHLPLESSNNPFIYVYDDWRLSATNVIHKIFTWMDQIVLSEIITNDSFIFVGKVVHRSQSQSTKSASRSQHLIGKTFESNWPSSYGNSIMLINCYKKRWTRCLMVMHCVCLFACLFAQLCACVWTWMGNPLVSLSFAPASLSGVHGMKTVNTS